jgi:hypothetical protein
VAESTGDTPVAAAAAPAPATEPAIPDPLAPAGVPDAKADLRTRVSSLAQAITQFSETGVTREMAKTSSLDLSGTLVASTSPVSLAAASMADVMKQFDANGNLVAKPGSTASTATRPIGLPGLPDPSSSGYLSTGGSK